MQCLPSHIFLLLLTCTRMILEAFFRKTSNTKGTVTYSQPSLRYSTDIYIKGLRKTTKTKGVFCLRRYSTQETATEKSEPLHLDLTCSVSGESKILSLEGKGDLS